MHPHVRLASARRCRRVDVAHVVADLVRTQLRKLGPHADARGPAVTGQRPRDELGDRDVERLDQRLHERTRALSGGGRLEHDLGHEALTVRVSWVKRVVPGSGTAVSTRSSISSAVTPSLSAS